MTTPVEFHRLAIAEARAERRYYARINVALAARFLSLRMATPHFGKEATMRVGVPCLLILAMVGCGRSKNDTPDLAHKKETSDLTVLQAKLFAKMFAGKSLTESAWDAAWSRPGAKNRGVLPEKQRVELAQIRDEAEKITARLGTPEQGGQKAMHDLGSERLEQWKKLALERYTEQSAAILKYCDECDVLEKKLEAGEVNAGEYERMVTEKFGPLWKSTMDRIEADTEKVLATAP